MVGLLSGRQTARVVIAYFDVNVGYVFNQVFGGAKKLLSVGASCARDRILF